MDSKVVPGEDLELEASEDITEHTYRKHGFNKLGNPDPTDHPDLH